MSNELEFLDDLDYFIAVNHARRIMNFVNEIDEAAKEKKRDRYENSLFYIEWSTKYGGLLKTLVAENEGKLKLAKKFKSTHENNPHLREDIP